MRCRRMILVLLGSALLSIAAQQSATRSTQNAKTTKKADTKTKKNKDGKLSDDEAGTRDLPPRSAKKTNTQKL